MNNRIVEPERVGEDLIHIFGNTGVKFTHIFGDAVNKIAHYFGKTLEQKSNLLYNVLTIELLYVVGK